MNELTPNEYKKLQKDDVAKGYKKAPTCLEKAVNLEAKEIAVISKMDDQIRCVPKHTTFIAPKDHKSNFRVATPCCLINPCKSELDKISKIILENVNMALVEIWTNGKTDIIFN